MHISTHPPFLFYLSSHHFRPLFAFVYIAISCKYVQRSAPQIFVRLAAATANISVTYTEICIIETKYKFICISATTK